MATRGAIARLRQLHPLQFAGRYHHWPSYPTELGKTLWNLYYHHFACDLDTMLRVLLDEHPAGWSSIIDADFGLTPAFGDPLHGDPLDAEEDGCPPRCYCHGGRSEEAWEVTQENAAGSGVEWVYAFASVTTTAGQCLHSMLVLASYHRDQSKMIGMFGCGDPEAIWKAVAVVEMQASEPDWEMIEQRATLGNAPDASEGLTVLVIGADTDRRCPR